MDESNKLHSSVYKDREFKQILEKFCMQMLFSNKEKQ